MNKLDRETCTAKEAAELSGRSLPTIYYWIRTGRVRRYWHQKQWVVDREDVLALQKAKADPDVDDLTADEAAEQAGCSRSTIFRAARRGEIRRRKHDGRILLVKEDVDKFKESLRAPDEAKEAPAEDSPPKAPSVRLYALEEPVDK